MPPSESTRRLSRSQVITLYAKTSFLQTVQGQLEQEVLDHVKKSAPQGDSQAVLDAIDSFPSDKGFLINIGKNKGRLVESVMNQHKPMVALELGSYVGYSAITQARKLPAGGKLYGIELDPTNARITQEMVQHAGLSHKVEILKGDLESSILELHKHGVDTVNYVLIDHAHECYLKDLLLLQHNGMLRKGSTVVADNVLLPGAPDYRRYINTSAHFSTVEHIVDLPASHFICDIMTVSKFLG
ncbi:MAG: catechol O-methyltransferase [Trebouxia sp. A1-2]|nr:MAG: catechol O-methyltransferase [Trebouxia sp. A1-2]